MSQQLADQQLARDILDDDPNAWKRFHEAYGERMLTRARKLLVSYPALRLRFQAGDLVQDFLIVKVLPKRQVMFLPIAKGGQPLWPRLCKSLVNHVKSLLRPINRAVREVGIDQPSQLRDQPRPPRSTARSIIVERLAACLDAIRAALPVPDGDGQVAYRLLLFLKVRMKLLSRLKEAYELADGDLPEGVSLIRMAEELVVWTSSEGAQTLLPNGTLTLDRAWAQLAALAAAANYSLDSSHAVSVLGILPNTWNVYQARAHNKTTAYHGHDIFAELFH